MSSNTQELTSSQLSAISVLERVCSVFSLLGCVFIIVTFATSKGFHKPINRLVFYASFGNMMTNVGTLMTREYIGLPNSVGCQFQAFLIQMFMPADAFWTLAMAVNVYLTFYFKYDAAKLRKMEVWYFVLCYGIPFVPALTFIFISNNQGQRFYGDATIWCWVAKEWDIWRIATFYGPVWVVILITFFIYIRAGGEIYKKRKMLKDFSTTTYDPEPLPMDDPNSFKTTEVMVTSEAIEPGPNGIDLTPLGGRGSENGGGSSQHNAAYSVTITSSKNRRQSAHQDFGMPIQSNVTTQPQTHATRAPPVKNNRRRANLEANNAAWSYTKCALLFFTAILITWIPSSANRVYGVIHAGEVSVPLEFMSSMVLPLQGFWNAAIYIVTSWKACQMFWGDVVHRTKRHREVYTPGTITDKRNHAFKLPSRRSNNDSESESMTELASRGNSNEELKRPVH